MAITTASASMKSAVPLASSSTARSEAPSLLSPLADELSRVERIFLQELSTGAPYVRDLITHLAHYRGKQLRPALLLLIAQACGGINEDHRKLAAVVEMIHTATLVHDDVLDQADLRRHVATVNSRWGNASSVLLGDLLFTHAFHLASQTGSALACQLIGEATNRVCEGELRQIGEQGNLQLSEDEYLEIITGKTAALIEISCRLGAVYAQAKPAIIEAMAQFGRCIGIAFQVADDVLDLVGTEKSAGKTLATDVLQQKLTLPMIHLLRHHPKHQAEATIILESPSPAGLTRFKQLLLEAGSVNYAECQAEQQISMAREKLRLLPESPERTTLWEMTSQIVRRTK